MINKLKIGDFFIVLLIILLSIGIFFISNRNLSNKKNDNDLYVSIQVNGKEIKRVALDGSVNGKKLPIETEYGYNLLEFTEDGVRSIEASCPDKIDVKQGLIQKPGETIVCLPNRLVVEIISESKIDVDEIDMVN